MNFDSPMVPLAFSVNEMEGTFLISLHVCNSSGKNEVWIYDPQNGFARHQGPSLKTGRHSHSCSTLKDDGKTLIYVAGGVSEGLATDLQFLDTVEIYDPTENNWHSGNTNSQPQKLYQFLKVLLKSEVTLYTLRFVLRTISLWLDSPDLYGWIIH